MELKELEYGFNALNENLFSVFVLVVTLSLTNFSNPPTAIRFFF